MKLNTPRAHELWTATHAPGGKGVDRSAEDEKYVCRCSDA
jgi:hypothetical protein